MRAQHSSVKGNQRMFHNFPPRKRNVSAARLQLDLRRALNTLVEVINCEHFTLPDGI
jgi:hypothetical protein